MRLFPHVLSALIGLLIFAAPVANAWWIFGGGLPQGSEPRVDTMKITGELDGDTSDFKVAFDAQVPCDDTDLPIVSGQLCEKETTVEGPKTGLVYKNGWYLLRCSSRGDYAVSFAFSSRVAKDAAGWRATRFQLRPAIARAIEVKVRNKDTKVEIPSALRLVKTDNPDGQSATYTAFLKPGGGEIEIKWRVSVEEIKADLVASAKANVVAKILPGAVRLDYVLDYSVIQGKLTHFEFEIPDGLGILNVEGDCVREWRVEKDGATGVLKVDLSREYEKDYRAIVKAEKVLSGFPCAFDVPKLVPLNMLRYEGFLAFGTDHAIKLIMDKTSGLEQIDNTAFPRIVLDDGKNLMQAPSRSAFSYHFTDGKYTMTVNADNIVPNFSADINYLLGFKDEDMSLRMIATLDIKDAPLKELLIRYDDALTVTRVEGQMVVPDDYQLFEKEGAKRLRIPLNPDTMGQTTVQVNFEKRLAGAASTGIPKIQIQNVKGVRGNLLLSAGKGLSLEASNLTELRELPLASAPVREPGLQLAYRFKTQDFGGTVSVKREKAVIISEAFHIYSIGDEAVYGSTVFTYNIFGAPVDAIRVSVDPAARNVEFAGRGIEDWKKLEGDVWKVSLKEKIMGDYTLLVTYEHALKQTDNEMVFGNVNTAGCDNENGYIAVSSFRNLNIAPLESSPLVVSVDPNELPADYRGLVRAPILKVFRFSKSPHVVKMGIVPFQAHALLGIVVDHSELTTRIDRNGEAVTTVELRIKNTSSQYLPFKLPTAAELWSVRIDAKNERVSVSDGALLIPLPRHKDVNQPIAISVVYAQKYGPLGSGAQLALAAPGIDIVSLFRRWLVSLPNDYDIVGYEGNLSISNEPESGGLSWLLKRTAAWYGGAAGGVGVVGWILTTLAGVILVISYARRKMRVLTTIIAVFMLLLGSAAILDFVGKGVLYKINTIKPFPVNHVEFTRNFNLPGDTLSVKLEVVSMKGVSLVRFRDTWSLLLGAVACLSLSLVLRRQSFAAPLLLAGGLTFALAAGSHWIFVGACASLVIALLFPVLVSAGLWAWLFRRLKAAPAAVAIAVVFLFTVPRAVGDEPVPPIGKPAEIIITDAFFDVNGTDKGVEVAAKLTVKTEGPTEFVLIPAPAVLTGDLPKDIDEYEIVRRGDDFIVIIKHEGEYTIPAAFLVPLSEENGSYTFSLQMPESLKNMVNASFSKNNVEFACSDAVAFKDASQPDKAQATAVFAPGALARFTVRPKLRDVEKEKAAFFAKIEAQVTLMPGFAKIRNVIDVRIARGEESKFHIEIPRNASVTEVAVPDLGGWRMDPATGVLEVLLTKPHHDDLRITVSTQIPSLELPYEVSVSPLVVVGADRQYGIITLASDQRVQFEVDRADGVTPVNTADFTNAVQLGQASPKKAYRHEAGKAAVTVKAVAVNPEIRVKENAEVVFEEDRVSMVSSLEVDISKAGIFTLEIDLPDGFDIDRVEGKGIQHWDETAVNGKGRLLVHFSQRALGAKNLQIALSRMEKERRKTVVIPKLKVVNSERLTGTLKVVVERGAKMDVVKRQGLEVAQTAPAKSRNAASRDYAFLIVRPDWLLEASFDAAAPWIQTEFLQTAKVSSGIVAYETSIKYGIENAGVKILRLRFPAGIEDPDISGRDIVGIKNPEPDVWEVELARKFETSYQLRVRHRQTWKQDEGVVVRPIVADGVELQKGYVAVFAEDRLQIDLRGTTGGVTDFNPRKIPASFGNDALANAVLCFRSYAADYSLTLAVKSHETARQLPAQVDKVDIVTVVSPEGRAITSVKIALVSGSERFLSLKLPKESTLWSIFVDDQYVDTAMSEGAVLIPLKQEVMSGKAQLVEVVYSGLPSTDETLSSALRQTFDGPRFELPLRNIAWILYLPKNLVYKDFGGTLDHVSRMDSFLQSGPFSSSVSDYDKINDTLSKENFVKAKSLFSEGKKKLAQGMNKEAWEAMENAQSLSESDVALNADIQGQLQQYQRDYSILALGNRRREQRQQANLKNITAAQKALPPAGEAQQAEQFERIQDATQMKQELGGEEVVSISAISDRIFAQQKAATNIFQPLRLTIPESGTLVRFERALQVTPGVPMQATVAARKAWRWGGSGLAAGVLVTVAFLALFVLLRSAFHAKVVE